MNSKTTNSRPGNSWFSIGSVTASYHSRSNRETTAITAYIYTQYGLNGDTIVYSLPPLPLPRLTCCPKRQHLTALSLLSS